MWNSKITLESTLKDWIKLQEQVIQIYQLDLDTYFWLDKLDPIILKLIESEIDEEFCVKIISLQYLVRVVALELTDGTTGRLPNGSVYE